VGPCPVVSARRTKARELQLLHKDWWNANATHSGPGAPPGCGVVACSGCQTMSGSSNSGSKAVGQQSSHQSCSTRHLKAADDAVADCLTPNLASPTRAWEEMVEAIARAGPGVQVSYRLPSAHHASERSRPCPRGYAADHDAGRTHWSPSPATAGLTQGTLSSTSCGARRTHASS
jgi:hypothetical protein